MGKLNIYIYSDTGTQLEERKHNRMEYRLIILWLIVSTTQAEKITLKASYGILFVEQYKSLIPTTGSRALNVMIKLPNKKLLDAQRPTMDDCKPHTTNLYDEMCKQALKEVHILADATMEIAEQVWSPWPSG